MSTPTHIKLLAFTTYAEPELRDKDSNELIAVTQAGGDQIALRLAACWNACEGVSTGNLEVLPGYKAAIEGFHKQRSLVVQARSQRDALLEALQVARRWMRSGECNCYQAADPDTFKAAEAQVDAAIAKATGQEGGA